MRIEVSRPLLALLVGVLSSCGGGGGGGNGGSGGGGDPGGGESLDPDVPDPHVSQFQVTPAFGTPADGVAEVEIAFRITDRGGRLLPGVEIQLDVTGFANGLDALAPTGLDGRTVTRLRSFAGETKRIAARAFHDGRLIDLGTREVVFLELCGNERFVRASGSDANSGRSPVEAWRTLAHALERAEAGMVIHVGAGIQAGPLRIDRAFDEGRPLVVRGDPSGRMTGDAGRVVVDGGGATFALELREAQHVVLRDLELIGAATGLGLEDSSTVTVLGCAARENTVGMRVEGVEEIMVADCRVSANRGDGIRLEDARRARIENNLIYGNDGAGLVLTSPTAAIAVRFNSLYRNMGGNLIGEEVGGWGAIEENILSEGGETDLSLLTDSDYDSTRNLVWSLPARMDPDGDLVLGDPLFAAPFGPDGILGGIGEQDDDFRVLDSSPALDAGTHSAREFLLGSRESLAARTTRADRVLEAQFVDADTANLGFHYPVAAPPFASVEGGNGHLVHVRPGFLEPGFLGWRRAAPAGLTTGLGPTLNAEPRWIESRLTPVDGPEELLATLIDTGTSAQLSVRRWNGRFWDDPFDALLVAGLPRAVLSDRGFDLEYEGRSGRAMLVNALDAESATYRILDHGLWSPPTPVPVHPGANGKIRWVELVPRRDGNDLALVTLTENGHLVALRWDGTTWSSPRLLETRTLFRSGWRPFDAAWENRSGDLLVTWSFSLYAEETRWAVLESASGSWQTGQHPSTDAVGAHVALASDPTSDRIAAVFGEAGLDGDVSVSMWDGSAWIDTAELTLLGPVRSHLPSVAWIGNQGIATVFFRRLGTSGSFDWAAYFPGGWRIQPAVSFPGVGRAVRIHLRSLVDQARLVGTLLDENGRLFGLGYDGTRFMLLGAGSPIAEGLDPEAPGRAFDVALRRP
jgi:hypothetical protein